MKAIQFRAGEGIAGLYIGATPDPEISRDEVLLHVAATALNRADLLQLAGHYPVPPGANPGLGLEVAGTVLEVGSGVTDFAVGDNVCALVNGGGFSQMAAVPASMLLRLPERLSFTKAAAVPEVWLTAYQALHWIAEIEAGAKVLIHAGASGVGTAAIQLVRLAGGIPIVTASPGKHQRLLDIGAERCIDYRAEDFAAVVPEITDGAGVDILLDFIGGPYLERNIQALAKDGRAVLLGLLGGRSAERLDLAPLLFKRISLNGTTLRSRSAAYKSRLTADFRAHVWPHFADRSLRPVVDSIYDWEDIKEACAYMKANANVGKIVVTIGE